MDNRSNFGALRLFAAFMVIHGHGWELTTGLSPSLWGVPFARIGVDVFFSVSGYLITRSWDRDQSITRFFLKRSLRIFPGLLLCVMVTVLVIGPTFTKLTSKEYFRDPLTQEYLQNVLLRTRLYLPKVFTSLRDGGAVNGSLWSLFPEFLCYIAVPISSRIFGSWRAATCMVIAFASGGLGMFIFYFAEQKYYGFYGLDLKYLFVSAPFFLVGSVLKSLEDSFGAKMWRADVCLLFFCSNFFVSAYVSWWNLPLEWIMVPYMAIAFGRMSLPVICDLDRYGDFSYGVYLYGFPLQQVIVFLLPKSGFQVLLCAAASIVIAWFSWHLVERPAQRIGKTLMQRKRQLFV